MENCAKLFDYATDVAFIFCVESSSPFLCIRETLCAHKYTQGKVRSDWDCFVPVKCSELHAMSVYQGRKKAYDVFCSQVLWVQIQESCLQLTKVSLGLHWWAQVLHISDSFSWFMQWLLEPQGSGWCCWSNENWLIVTLKMQQKNRSDKKRISTFSFHVCSGI